MDVSKGNLNSMEKTPRVAICIVVNDEDKMLMGKRNDNDRMTVPAGHCDKGECPFLAAARELKEETGLDAKEIKMVRCGINDQGLMLYLFEVKVDKDQEVDCSKDPDQECDDFTYEDPFDHIDVLHVEAKDNWALKHWAKS